jgi:uncharacterized heparinase superfamily protein
MGERACAQSPASRDAKPKYRREKAVSRVSGALSGAGVAEGQRCRGSEGQSVRLLGTPNLGLFQGGDVEGGDAFGDF